MLAPHFLSIDTGKKICIMKLSKHAALDRKGVELMRKKDPKIMEHIIEFTKGYQRENGRSPSTTEIANEVGVARGTAYTYLTAMRDRGMIDYDGKNIMTQVSDLINHGINNTPIVGRVICGDPVEEEENVQEYIDLPVSIFGSGELFILQAYGDSMNQAGIDEGDYVVVRKQSTAHNGELVVALTNNENNLKRISFDDENKRIILSPESDNPIHKPKAYQSVQIQGVVTHIIKEAR